MCAEITSKAVFTASLDLDDDYLRSASFKDLLTSLRLLRAALKRT